MVGQIKYAAGGKGRREWGKLYGLPVLRVQVDPKSWLPERRLRKAGRALNRAGVVDVLVPPTFSEWSVLEPFGLRPVEVGMLVRACSGEVTLAAMRRMGMQPRQATVALRGERVDGDMKRAARVLCAEVRNLMICAPRGGEALALQLHREFGVPILPERGDAQVGVYFGPVRTGGERVCLGLYGYHPNLAGVHIRAPELEGEDQENLALLTALWQGGKVRKEGLKIT